MPNLDVFDLDKEFSDMVECSIHSKTIEEQVLRYTQLKQIEESKNK